MSKNIIDNEKSEKPTLNITLSPDGVLGPMSDSLKVATDIVYFGLLALEKVDFSKGEFKPKDQFFVYKFTGSITPPDELKAKLKSWLLGAGFRELMRGIHSTLEQAYIYLHAAQITKMISGAIDVQLANNLLSLPETAKNKNFPELITAVNKQLPTQIAFEKEYSSLNKARNCLEHFDGIVPAKYIDKSSGTFVLTFPYVKFFIQRNNGKEEEICKGAIFEKGEGVGFKLDVAQRIYRLGERIEFSVDEFHKIGFGCILFVQDLVSKLPRPSESSL